MFKKKKSSHLLLSQSHCPAEHLFSFLIFSGLLLVSAGLIVPWQRGQLLEQNSNDVSLTNHIL